MSTSITSDNLSTTETAMSTALAAAYASPPAVVSNIQGTLPVAVQGAAIIIAAYVVSQVGTPDGAVQIQSEAAAINGAAVTQAVGELVAALNRLA